jgi:hypothetical protein
MKGVAIFWIVLPLLTALFPELAVPVFVFVVLSSVFFGVGDTLWLDEIPYEFDKEVE